MRGLLEYWLPEQGSSFAGDVDALFVFILLVVVFFFILVVAAGTYMVVKYRRKPGDRFTSPIDSNHTLEWVWTVIPSIILFIIFVWGFKTFMKLSVVPPRAMQVKVVGQKWFWTFAYDNGVVSTGEMVVPINKPVKALLSSKDVLHSMFVPAFRVKQDALPNRYTQLWFTATKIGEYPMYCTEYCGTSHSTMTAVVRVVSEADFAQWLQDKASESTGMSLVDVGRKVYQQNACFTCHSLDGSGVIGPTWQGAYGSTRSLTDGSKVLVDENYIREAILNPMAKIAAGYQPIMPTYQGLLNENQIEGVIEYMKTLK